MSISEEQHARQLRKNIAGVQAELEEWVRVSKRTPLRRKEAREIRYDRARGQLCVIARDDCRRCPLYNNWGGATTKLRCTSTDSIVDVFERHPTHVNTHTIINRLWRVKADQQSELDDILGVAAERYFRKAINWLPSEVVT